MAMTNRLLMTIANGQLGIVTRVAANAAGVSDRQLRSRVESGFLLQIGPNAFRLAGGARDPMCMLRGAVADIGPPCWASGASAAAVFGFDGFVLRPPFHVTVPRGRYLRRRDVVVHVLDALAPIDREEHDGLPITSPVRTLIDLSATAPADRLTAALDSALRDRLATESAIRQRATALRVKGRRGIPALLAVLDGKDPTRGGHSWLEREFLRLVARADLPRPTTQQVLSRVDGRIVRVDCRFPGTDVVVELLGHRFHRSAAQMRRDAERLNALLLDGYAGFQFTYGMVVDQPTTTINTVRQALHRFRSAIPTDSVGIADQNTR